MEPIAFFIQLTGASLLAQGLIALLQGILFLSVALILLVLFGYPAILWAVTLLTGRRSRGRDRPRREAGDAPRVSLLIVVRNGEDLIENKIRNSLELDHPADRLEIVVFSDGSTDRTVEIARRYTDRGVEVHESPEHIGKNEALNRAVPLCTGDIVLFSDGDAMLGPDSLARLVAHFDDPAVGGCCGRRVLGTDTADLRAGQVTYARFDLRIKQLESNLGGITSNDGKIHAIRRELFRPITRGATDDLCLLLSVVEQGFRYEYESRATASVPVPSRGRRHEVLRRRRIVSCSLRGIWQKRELMNPARTGWFALGLFVNKICRRLLPFALLGLFISSGLLAIGSPLAAALFIPQVVFYAAGLAYPVLGARSKRSVVGRLAAKLCYFTIGNYAMGRGVLDFIAGREPLKWDPVKSDRALETLGV